MHFFVDLTAPHFAQSAPFKSISFNARSTCVTVSPSVGVLVACVALEDIAVGAIRVFDAAWRASLCLPFSDVTTKKNSKLLCPL